MSLNENTLALLLLVDFFYFANKTLGLAPIGQSLFPGSA